MTGPSAKVSSQLNAYHKLFVDNFCFTNGEKIDSEL